MVRHSVRQDVETRMHTDSKTINDIAGLRAYPSRPCRSNRIRFSKDLAARANRRLIETDVLALAGRENAVAPACVDSAVVPGLGMGSGGVVSSQITRMHSRR